MHMFEHNNLQMVVLLIELLLGKYVIGYRPLSQEQDMRDSFFYQLVLTMPKLQKILRLVSVGKIFWLKYVLRYT